MTAHSFGDKLLHKLALGSDAIPELSFDLERAFFGRSIAAQALSCPVFVCGLARSGSSALTRAIEAQGGFVSLRYRDMPFSLAPNLWAVLSRGDKRNVASEERGHGDGLDHDLDSPEAIEEIFWRVFEGSSYLGRDLLKDVQPHADTMKIFGSYMKLVSLRYGGGRYLSKNNNNLLRARTIAAEFPDATLVHPFRDPVQQVASLMDIHQRTVAIQRREPFRKNYSTWLSHHEFGCDHRPFSFGGFQHSGEGDNPNFWLAQWSQTYLHILEQPLTIQSCQLLVDIDACATDAGYSSKIISQISGRRDCTPVNIRAASNRPAPTFSKVELERAVYVHSLLRKRARKDLG